MTANPLMDQYAADVRRRHAAKNPAARREIRRIASRAAADIAKDLPGMGSEQLGAVLLRTAAFARNLVAAQPDASAMEVAGLLEAAGEFMYHQAPTGEGADGECLS